MNVLRLFGSLLVLGSVLSLCTSQATSQATTTSALQGASLRPTFGGVLLQARFIPKGNVALNGVWADTGRANLMHCAPSCTIVEEIPLRNAITLSQNSTYRVVLGGKFKPHQNVKLLLRFTKGDMLTVSVPVAGK